MAEINHEIKIKGPIEKVYGAVSTVNGLKAWHTAHIEGQPNADGIFTCRGQDSPSFTWKVIEDVPNKTLSWQCLDGPGDSKGTKVIYRFSTSDNGRTLVELIHTWPHQQGNFRKCNTLWGGLLHHLKAYVENGKVEPAVH